MLSSVRVSQRTDLYRVRSTVGQVDRYLSDVCDEKEFCRKKASTGGDSSTKFSLKHVGSCMNGTQTITQCCSYALMAAAVPSGAGRRECGETI